LPTTGVGPAFSAVDGRGGDENTQTKELTECLTSYIHTITSMIPQQQARESVMAMGVPTDIMLGWQLPQGTWTMAPPLCFYAFYDPNENDSVGYDNAQDVYDCRGTNLLTPAGGCRTIHGDQGEPHKICLNWKLLLASLGATAPTGCFDGVLESIRQLFLAQVHSADCMMAKFCQEMARC
jgi:hypothetical protein